jgi:hypothetical protein
VAGVYLFGCCGVGEWASHIALTLLHQGRLTFFVFFTFIRHTQSHNNTAFFLTDFFVG